MKQFKIEKGIPMPKQKTAYGSMADTLRDMKVGDSFKAELEREQSIRSNTSAYAKTCNKKFSIHKVSEGGEIVIRVWRIQ